MGDFNYRETDLNSLNSKSKRGFFSGKILRLYTRKSLALTCAETDYCLGLVALYLARFQRAAASQGSVVLINISTEE
ncbi:hypothetical protein SK128_020928 [Halocaridina rubra]|uniref:Uncharacterized protein n=1 Tax=Halocaridina rubra TaxID=373956 RepID=A0AAN8WQ41_HALRR